MSAKLKVIIVEDIVSASNTLSIFLQDIENVRLVDICNNYENAIASIKQNKPDVILLDIKIGKHVGFEILDACKGYYSFVIITSAYEEYAIKSYDYNTIHYLLKPIVFDEFKIAFDKIKLRINEIKNDVATDSNLIDLNKKILYSENKYWKSILYQDIIYIQADGSYCKVFTNHFSKTFSKNLITMISEINEPFLTRVHKSHAININHILTFKKGLKSTVLMSNNVELPISNNYKKDFFKLIYESNKT
jgi:two-component system LytT family response regulator